MSEYCINCDFFYELNPGVDNTGQCRALPPRGIDDKSLPSTASKINVFPYIENGSTESCGEFKPLTEV